MDKKNWRCGFVPLAVLASVGVALGQLPADLSAGTPIATLSGPNLSPDLSGGDSIIFRGLSGSGSRPKAATGGRPSVARAGNAAASGSQGSPATPQSAVFFSRAALLTSRATRFNGKEKVLQESRATSVWASAQAGPKSGGSTSPFVPRIPSSVLSRSTPSTLSAPRSFSSRSSALEAPLYSFLVRHDKSAPRSGSSAQGFSWKSGHAKKSRGGLIQSLPDTGSGLGLSR